MRHNDNNDNSGDHSTTDTAAVDAGRAGGGGRVDGVAVRAWWRRARVEAAITEDAPEAAGFAAFGAGSMLAFPQGVLHGTHRVAVGARCLLNEHVVLSAGPIVFAVPAGPAIIELDDDVRLGRRCELVALESLTLGAGVGIAPNCYLTDHNHTRRDPDAPISTQPLEVAATSIGAGCSLGVGVTVLAGAHIGAHTHIAAGAVVTRGHYPPQVVLAGVPARVI